MNLSVYNHKINCKLFIYFIIFVTLFMNVFIDFFKIPSTIKYLNDFFILLLFLMLVFKKNLIRTIRTSNSRVVLFFIVIFSIVNIISIILNLVPINLVLWAFRNTYRFFIFYLACIVFLEKKDIYFILNLLCSLQIVNFLLIMYQYFILGLKQDYLGGLFGQGGNSGLLIYSVIILTYSIVRYNSKSMSLIKFLFILITTIISSVLAELRVFFIIIAIIIFLNFLITKFTLKKLVVIFGVIILFFISVNMYEKIFPYVDLSFEAFISEGSSTGGGYNLSRLSGISNINKIFFNDDFLKNSFGYGFGNCEYSSFEIFTSNFYKIYGDYHYRWFTHLWVFLETGYFGIVSYLLIIISIFFQSFKCIKNKFNQLDFDCIIFTCIISVIMILMFFYNSLLKADFAYLAFFALSISSVIIKSNKNLY